MKTPAELNPNINEPAPSPFGFANVPAFEKSIEIKIQGIIPSWVNGVLYRSGMFIYYSYEAYHLNKKNRIWKIQCLDG